MPLVDATQTPAHVAPSAQSNAETHGCPGWYKQVFVPASQERPGAQGTDVQGERNAPVCSVRERAWLSLDMARNTMATNTDSASTARSTSTIPFWGASEMVKLLLFDVDGTLTEPMQPISRETKLALREARRNGACIGVVGGSGIQQILSQLGADALDEFDYVFAENGLVAYARGELIHRMELKDRIHAAELTRLINFLLRYIADLDIPVKRGTFVQYRTGMLNVCPIGRDCSTEERVAFHQYDQVHGVRRALVQAITREFPSLRCSVGGMISVDVFPHGWDKTYCLQHVLGAGFERIHFFGDKTSEGGNDFEIFSSAHTVGHSVSGPGDTVAQMEKVFADVH